MRLPDLCVVDTNVPIIANYALRPEETPLDSVECVITCIEAIEHVKRTEGLIIDTGDEIYDEYRKKLKMKGQPGVGDSFMKWVHDHRYGFPESNRVNITKYGDSYIEFPADDELNTFHKKDRKFVAVANAHSQKPPILQAADCKWLEWKDGLDRAGIRVIFLCPEYVKEKFKKKKK